MLTCLTFMAIEQDPDAVVAESKSRVKAKPADAASSSSSSEVMNLPATREEFTAAQQGDSTLSKCHVILLVSARWKQRPR